MQSYRNMNRNFSLKIIVLLPAIIFVCFLFAQTTPPQPAAYNQKLQSSSLLFMENKGQIADDKGNLRPDILFTANSAGAKIYLSANSIHYQFTKTEYPKGYDPYKKEPVKDPEKEVELQKQIKQSTYRFSLELQSANLHPAVTTEKQSAYTENYYLAQCPNGITGVHGYEKITYNNVYPNIDWIIYSKGGFMEYDFLVHPGGDATAIKLKIKDADAISINDAGELVMKTSLGEVRQKAPVSYADGRPIESFFKQSGDGTIGFDVQVQPEKELRIDPSIIWATYYGGNSNDLDAFCSTDVNGNVYLTGVTYSNSDISSGGGFQNIFGGGSNDAFLVKFDSSGNRIWATYYGGNGFDYGTSSIVDGNGNIYLAGLTSSTNTISSLGFQNSFSGVSDAFLVKFTTSGVRIWGTYYGGSDREQDITCCIDNSNNIYLSGTTSSLSGIASGGFQNINATLDNLKYDAFLVKFNSSGNRLWATYYGGEYFEFGNSCAADPAGNIYLCGRTNSPTGIAFGGFQNNAANGFLGSDAFLVKFDGSGNRLWATYYGGNGSDEGLTCVTDAAGNVFVAGLTQSTDVIAFNGFQNTYQGGIDGFLVKFNSSGNRIWGTYCGGANGELVKGCSVDGAGDIFITGYTQSVTNIASCGFQNTYQGGQNVFIVKVNSTGSRVWGSYYGGPGNDLANACAADNFGNVFVSGFTNSASGIAINGFQNTLNGANDAFLVKIGAGCIPATMPILADTAKTICYGSSASLTIVSGNLNSSAQWYWYKDSCGGLPLDTGISINVSPVITTTYYVRGEGCCTTSGNCAAITVNVNTAPAISIVVTPASICSGDTVTVVGNNAFASSIYNWNWGGGIVISGSNAGPYKVVYVVSSLINLTAISGSCTTIAMPQMITVNPAPFTSFAVTDSTGCDTLTVRFINISPPVLGAGYRWDFGDGNTTIDIAPQPHNYTNGVYKVTLTEFNGPCPSAFTRTVRVVASPVAAFTVAPGINTPVQLSRATFNFTNTSQNATHYIWRFTNADSTSAKNPSYQFTSAGNYAISLYAYNNTGCADTFELKPLLVVADSTFHIPNAFSPNNDGINDTWVIYGLQGITDCKVSIFNRWGQSVFSSTGYNRPWDGSYKEEPLPVDSYYYVITANNRSYTGLVMLLR